MRRASKVEFISGPDIPKREMISVGVRGGKIVVLDRPASNGPKRGRRKMAQQDMPLVDEMRDLIRQGVASSWKEAADKVADRAVGAGSRESKVTRLQKRVKGEPLPSP